MEHNIFGYETINWEAEAKRVALAFGVKTPCRFRLKTKDSKERRDLLSGGHTHIIVHENLRLSVLYKPHTLWFKLHDENVASYVTVGYSGEICQFSAEFKYTEQIVKGLFHLGLLVPSTEFLLNLSISEHQKLEWQLEYADRLRTSNITF